MEDYEVVGFFPCFYGFKVDLQVDESKAIFKAEWHQYLSVPLSWANCHSLVLVPEDCGNPDMSLILETLLGGIEIGFPVKALY